MPKREAEVQISKDGREDPNEENGSTGGSQFASAEVLRTRKIAKPGGRYTSQSSTGAFGGIGTWQSQGSRVGAAGSLTSNSQLGATSLETTTPSVDPSSPVKIKPRDPSDPLYAKFKGLNDLFLGKINNYAHSSSNGSDWSAVCEKYLSYARDLNRETGSRAFGNAAESQHVSIPANVNSNDVSDHGVGKITGSGFKFGQAGSSNGATGFKFGDKTISFRAGEDSTSSKSQGGFIYQPSGTGKLASEDQNATIVDKSDTSIADSSEQAMDAEMNDGPTFTFGPPGPSPDKGAQLPKFTFSNSQTPSSTPSQSTFGSGFTFGQPSSNSLKSSTPQFGIPSSASGGSNTAPEASKPSLFSSSQSAPAAPKFTFGMPSAEKPSEPASFKFGPPTTVVDKASSSTAPSTVSTEPTKPFGESSSTSNKPFQFTFGNTTSGPAKPQPLSFNFGKSSNPEPAASAPGGSGFFGATKAANADKDDADGEDGAAGEEEPDEQQRDLVGKGAGEENEDAVYEKRAKIFQLKEGAYEPMGVGSLRVLVDKTTKKSRVLVRADPSGRVLINISLRSQLKYPVEGKNQVKVVDFQADGAGPLVYLVRVKTEDDAQELSQSMESVKSE